MKKIIQVAKPFFSASEINEIKNTIKTGWIAPGPKTLQMENLIKKKLGVKHVVAVNSCTSGIAACLVALGAKKGDEVLTPSNTFISTINTLYNFNLKIKLCDVDINTWSVSDDLFRKNLTKKTKFFIPVHFGGNPTDITKIISTAKKNKIKIIEDAATAFGSKINKKFIGSFNNSVAVFSLHANKVITSADGGFITLNNRKLALKIRRLINSGLKKDSWERKKKNNFKPLNAIQPGFKFNYNHVLASIAVVQLKKINHIINYRHKLSKIYEKELTDLILNKKIFLQKSEKNNSKAYYCFQILLEDRNIREKRAYFLQKNKVSTTVYYTPAHMHDFYRKKLNNKNLKNTNKLFYNSLALPFHNNLKSFEIKKVTNLIKYFFKNYD